MPYIQGVHREQINILPNTLDDYVACNNPVRVIDAYVDSLNLEELGFKIYSNRNAGQNHTIEVYYLRCIYIAI